MKKLLTTMSAVAAAMSLYATEPGPLSGTSFEGLTGDAPYDIYASTGELTALAANETYWVTNGTETLTVVAGVSDAENRPAPYEDATQTKYLNIKTTLGNPVTRNVSTNGAGTSIGTGFYFDSLVKFTAFDDDPAIDLNGGKLAVWLKENLDANDEPTSTNLMVTAGFLDGQGGAIVTNYTCTVTGPNLNDGGWHRVTVKAIADITNGGQVPGFVVYVDTVRATSGAEKGIDASELSQYAYLLNSEGSLFPSAAQSGLDKDAIAAVQFDGQGDVDDLLFTTAAPDFAKDAEFFAINLGENVTSVQGLIDGVTTFNISASTSIVWTAGQAVQILTNYVTCASGFMFGSVTNQAGTEVAVDDAYQTTAGGSITVTAKSLGAYVDDTPYETLADAVAAANVAGSSCTVKLAADAAAGITINNANSGVTITLDLAGHEIAAASGNPAAILVEGGAVSIIDSVGGGTVTADEVSDVLGNAVVADGGTVTITAGTYDGKIIDAAITGGGFLATYKGNDVNTKAALDGMIVGNYEATITPGTNYYGLTEKAADVAKIGETGYETLAAAIAAAKTTGDASAPVTITLLDDVTEAGFQLAANNFGGYGLVLDLGGHTYTMNATVSGSSDPIDVRTNNVLTISNGTLAVSCATRDLARIYGCARTVVTFEDVTISGASLPAESSSKPVGVFQIEGGTVNFLGTTSIDSGENAPYAIKFGNHANQTQYVCETVTVNTTGNIIGDILLSGGTYNEVAIGAGSSGDYYYGTNTWSTWEDANNVVFAARDGELSAAGSENNVSGKLYKTFDAAIAATNEFTLLKDYAGNVTFTTATKIKANGHELTGTLTAPEGYAVDLVEGVYQAARYTITFVAEGGTVDPASTNYTSASGTITLPTAIHGGGVGLQFGGWTNETYTTAITEFTPAAGNLGNFTLYAKWTAGGPTYPTYLENADAAVKAQYLAWAQTYGADENSVYEDAFLLNVAPDTTGATLAATAISISGTKVTINLNRGNLNGVPYVKKATTVAGLANASKTAIEITPADGNTAAIDNGGYFELTGESDAAKFYQIGVQSTPVAVPNNN